MKAAMSWLNRLLLFVKVSTLGLLLASLLACGDEDPGDSNSSPKTGSPADSGSPAGSPNNPVNPGDSVVKDYSGGSSSSTNSPGISSNKPGSNPSNRRSGKPGTQSESIGQSGTLQSAGNESIGQAGTSKIKKTDKTGSGSSSTFSSTPAQALSSTVSDSMSRAPSGDNRSADERGSPESSPGSDNSGLQAPTLKLETVGIKTFRFTWADISGETEYRLLEKVSGSADYKQVATLAADSISHELKVFLPRRINARYILQACNGTGCANSAALWVNGMLAEAVGYLKASNTGDEDRFGHSVAISGDGNTLAVGAPSEDSAAGGINGEQNNNSFSTSGAVYVFTRSGGNWIQQAYVKASNSKPGEEFGYSLALSDDGNTLAVGAGRENSDIKRINGDVNTSQPSGGVYLFIRKAGAWTQQVYVKASNLADKAAADSFGVSVSLSGDGKVLAVGADGEGSNATGINRDQNNGQAKNSGAAYIFARNGGDWVQQAYIKASNTEPGDHFGRSVSLSNDGDTLAVGAVGEDSAAAGINENQQDNTAKSSGAVYVYTRSGANWTQQAYMKASNNRPGDLVTGDEFGVSVALSGNGNTLAVGARFEDSLATGINGNQHASSNHSSGAVYIFTRKGGNWLQQAYVKASNTGWGDEFGISVALSGNGNTLAVGAVGEDSHATGINGDEDNNMFKSPGAAYVFTRSGGNWVQRAYVKACNTMHVPRNPEHAFGFSVALADAGDTLAVGAPEEDSAATGINDKKNGNFAGASGAVYLY